MKVAVAGSGHVATYLYDEFKKAGHDVLVLTRHVNEEDYPQKETDYSVASLVEVLAGCEALISTAKIYSGAVKSADLHLDMLEACKQSKTCKTFIPSEWTINAEEYPEQPMFLADSNKKLHPALIKEKSVRSTIVCNAWFMDYILPQKQRHLADAGDAWPMNWDTKVFTIYGPGTQLTELVMARDVAKAVVALVESKEPWQPYTYLSASQVTWNELFATMKKSHPEWTSKTKPLAETVTQIVDNKSPESVVSGQFELVSYSGASRFPKEKVEKHRAKYFQGLHFQTVEEVLAAAEKEPERIF